MSGLNATSSFVIKGPVPNVIASRAMARAELSSLKSSGCSAGAVGLKAPAASIILSRASCLEAVSGGVELVPSFHFEFRNPLLRSTPDLAAEVTPTNTQDMKVRVRKIAVLDE